MTDVSHAASVQFQIIANNYVCAASLVILFYDYILTLPREIERFWSRKTITWASTFFYLNRYLSLFGHIPVGFQIFWRSSAPERLNVSITGISCLHLLSYHQYLAVVIQTIVGILLIMRTYALYGRKLWILLCMCAAAAAVIIYGTICVVKGASKTITTVEDLPLAGCTLGLTDEDSIRLASAWTANLCFDILIFSLTVYKSVTRIREVDSTLLNVLLVDGAIYFGVMVIAGVTVIVTFRVLPSYERGLTVTLTNVISSTMLSRLMLNLRDPKLLRNSRTMDNNMSTAMVFTSFMPDSTFENCTRQDREITRDTHNDIEMIPRTSIQNNSQHM